MVKNSKYEILTPGGFKDFKGIRKLEKSEFLILTLSNNKIIKCSANHPFILDGCIITANNLSIGSKIDSILENIYVIHIEFIEDNIDLFDLIEVEDGNVFIVDDIISHNCDWLTSGHTVIESEILQFYNDKTQEPIERRGIGGDLWIWKYPDKLRDYVICADPARGDGEDYSGFHVVDVETIEQVAEYKGKIDTQAFGRMLIAVATEYNDALLVIDNKNIGWSTVQVVIDSGYKNLYYSYKNDPYLDENIHLRKAYDMKQKEDMVPGLTTTTRLRPVFISKLEMYFREKTPIIYSKRLMNELYVFMWTDGKAQAQRGYNDDLVMSFAMCLYIRDTALRMRQMGIELVKTAIMKMHKPVYKSVPIGQSQWEMNAGQAGNKEDLRWLL